MIPVTNVGAVGIVSDLPPNEIPLNAWTAGKNIRFIDGAVEKFTGHSEMFATPTWAPYWLIPITTGSSYYWVYCGVNKIGVTDGVAHADITRVAGGDYTTNLNIGWTGTVIENIVVVNNGSDVPQMWTPLLTNKMGALTGWTSTHVARAMRSLKRYLVALSVTKAGVHYPYMIKWSHQAPSGAVPTSWDETSTTNDAGEWTLSADGGFLIDGISLRDDLVLYKESQTWLMQYVGGVDVFRFTKKFSEIGMLARKCAVEFFIGKHVVFTGDDVVLHDGQQGESIISRRLISSITSIIDTYYYQRSFVVANYAKKEVWVCFPETNYSVCTKALVWNWKENTWGIRDLPDVTFITSGIIDPITPADTWATAVGGWSTDFVAWGDRLFDPTQRKLLMAVPSLTKLYTPDVTQQFATVDMTSYVEKTAIGFPLKADRPPDYTTEKLVRGIWPRIRGTAGGVVNVYVGTQERIDGAVTYQSAFPFTIGTTEYVDCLLASKLHALKFESTTNIQWKLDGYDVDVVPTGQHGGR